MPTLDLLWKAELENIESVTAGPDVRYYVKVKCSNCGESPENWVYIDPNESVELVRSEVNLAIRCKFCKRENSVDLVKSSQAAYDAAEGGFQRLASFDCRGVELTDFQMRSGFVAVAVESGTRVEIEFDGDDFCDYDDAGDQSISIMDVEARFQAASKK